MANLWWNISIWFWVWQQINVPKTLNCLLPGEYFFLSMLKTQLKLASPPFFSPADKVDTNFQTPVAVQLDQLVHTQSRKLLCSLWIVYPADRRGHSAASSGTLRGHFEKVICLLEKREAKKPESLCHYMRNKKFTPPGRGGQDNKTSRAAVQRGASFLLNKQQRLPEHGLKISSP